MIHELKIGEESLYIAEDLHATAQQLRDLYWRRNDVEVDIRNIKTVLGTENMRAKSVEMFHKEFAMAMVAYNLTTQLRREAAKIANCAPRKISFTGVWSVYRHMLQGIEVRNPSEWQAQLERALNYASKLTLPNRPDVVILGKPTPSLQILTLSETKKTAKSNKTTDAPSK